MHLTHLQALTTKIAYISVNKLSQYRGQYPAKFATFWQPYSSANNPSKFTPKFNPFDLTRTTGLIVLNQTDTLLEEETSPLALPATFPVVCGVWVHARVSMPWVNRFRFF